MPLDLSGALPADAPGRRVALPDPYVYKSRLMRIAARTLDAVGQPLFGSPAPKVDWSSQRKVAVLRLDHLGDLLVALPALRRLKRALPQAQLELWVGPWGESLAGLFADLSAVRVSPASWFRRPQAQAWPLAEIRALARGMRDEHYDAAFDLRGDLRDLTALRMAGIPVRAGQTLTGGSFLLTHPGHWQADLHEQEQHLRLLDDVGVPAANQGSEPYLKLPASAFEEAEAVVKAHDLGPRPILVQASCGTLAKRWSPEAWAKVLQGLPADQPVALLGSESEREEMQAIARRVQRPIAVAAGVSLPGLAALFLRARLLLSVDTGPAHLAVIQGLPVVSLFSGTTRAVQWAPKDPGLERSAARVTVLQAQNVPCSPCELSVCPYGNACMNAIEPADVLRAADDLLRAA